MRPSTKLKIQNIQVIIAITLIFGLLYNFFFYPRTLVEFLEAGSISIFLGIIIGVLEEFVLKRTFNRLSSLVVSVLRIFIYSFLISLVLAIVLSVEISMLLDITYTRALKQYLSSPEFQRDLLFSFGFISVTLFILQIIQLIGKRNFVRLLFGLYRQPREVSRIFMFLDLMGSTSLGERLDNKMYSAFIRDFFYDISDAIMISRGEIYQYAGDEIIVVWPLRNKNVDCVHSFFMMESIIERKREIYLAKYGITPNFKAAYHFGKVIVTTVGKIKKEIVYHGDVLNTTARIEGKCNELHQKILVSKDMLPFIKHDKNLTIKEKGNIMLKGKSRKLTLYGIQRNIA